MSVHVFGIRHHGPGSARSLAQALAQLQPDIVLVEGPPDAEPCLPLLTRAEMQPPVALLVYVPHQPHQAVYYPFAVFSPEWQAIHYGLTQQIPVWLIDLPQTHQFALDQAEREQAEREQAVPPDQAEEAANLSPAPPVVSLADLERRDPLALLAQAAGEEDGERWWELLVEQRQDSTELFTAILTAMTALRTEVEQSGSVSTPREAQREAYMRQRIRAAQKQGFKAIAVVCGAWHAPALGTLPAAKADAALLKGLPKLKVTATWIPWTYRHLALSSGYGAGIESPGWYQHLWQQGQSGAKASALAARDSAIHWMTQVARLLRQQDLDASSASVIEAVRLAETLAALRDRSFPGLGELTEAAQTVLCLGNELPLQLIHQHLIVGDRLGQVPPETPMVPLQQDLLRQQKRLRLLPDASVTALGLDLRKPTDLGRSHLLHRLRLLDVPWADLRRSASAKGTFRESWAVGPWEPSFDLRLIEAGIWGNTIDQAAAAATCDRANRANLPALTSLIEQTLLADLPDAIAHLIERLATEAAIASDISHLMTALPPLVNVLRYGSVRQVEVAVLAPVVEGLITRICIGLPVAAASLDDEAAAGLTQRLVGVQSAIALLQQPDALAQWHQVLTQLSDQPRLHGLVTGRCCRLLFEAGLFTPAETTRRLGVALSTATDPSQAAAWVEGFLAGNGLLLLHHPHLWQVLDDWVMQQSETDFVTLLPLLRRTFASFTAPERRQMGERVRQSQSQAKPQTAQPDEPAQSAQPVEPSFDCDRADEALPLIAQLLGLSLP